MGMNKPLTVKQRKLVRGVVDTGNIAEAGRSAGYEHRQSAHRALTNVDVMTAIEVELSNVGIDDSTLAAAIGRLLNSDNEKSVNNAIAHIIKLKGLAKPTKHLTVKANYADYAKTALYGDKAQLITTQHSQEATSRTGVGLAMVPSVTLS